MKNAFSNVIWWRTNRYITPKTQTKHRDWSSDESTSTFLSLRTCIKHRNFRSDFASGRTRGISSGSPSLSSSPLCAVGPRGARLRPAGAGAARPRSPDTPRQIAWIQWHQYSIHLAFTHDLAPAPREPLKFTRLHEFWTSCFHFGAFFSRFMIVRR